MNPEDPKNTDETPPKEAEKGNGPLAKLFEKEAEEAAAKEAEEAEKQARKAAKTAEKEAEKKARKAAKEAKAKEADAAAKKAVKKDNTNRRQPNMPGKTRQGKMCVTWQHIEDHVEKLVLDAAGRALSGKEKRKRVVHGITVFVDKALVFGPGPIGLAAEALDGPLARLVGGLLWDALAQHTYDRLKDSPKFAQVKLKE